MGVKSSYQKAWSVAKPLITFTTPKKVNIVDWRLGLLYYALTLAIFIFVLWDVITKQSFLVNESPNSYVNVWAGGGEAFKEAQDQIYEANRAGESNATYEYCTGDHSYVNFKYDDSYIFEDFKCAVFPAAGLNFKPSPKEFYFLLNKQEQKYIQRYAESADACPTSFGELGAGVETVKVDGRAVPADMNGPFSFEYRANHCMYHQQNNFMAAGVENMTMYFDHSYDTSLVGVNGDAPLTHVRRKGSDENLFTFEEGKTIQADLAQWLAWAGVDLDLQWDEQPNTLSRVTSNTTKGQGWSTDDHPTPRLSGMDMQVSMSYYNYAQAPGHDKGFDNGPKSDVVCILELSPKMKWSNLRGNVLYPLDSIQDPYYLTADNRKTDFHFIVDSYSHGVMFIFESKGIVGKFDYAAFIAAVVSGLVLVGVAETVVTYVALYALGLQSELYTEFIKEDVDYRKEYARFATSAIVASEIFFKHDTSGDRRLSRDEVLSILKNVFPSLPKAEVEQMTHYLMVNAQMSADESEGVEDDAVDTPDTVSLVEWVNIFTDSRTSLQAFKRIMSEQLKKKSSEEGAAEQAAVDVDAGNKI